MPLRHSPSLTSLPVEILTQIAAGLDSVHDVLALANSCKLFRAVFETHVAEISDHVVPRCIGLVDEARLLMLVQEKQFEHATRQSRLMQPQMFLRIARNATKVAKAKAWFNKNIVSRVQPTDTEWCMEVYGARKRPPHMTKTEELRFERAYYLAATVMEPDSPPVIETLVLRHLYYLWDMTHLQLLIGEEQYDSEQRNRLRRECRSRMESLWDKYVPEKELSYRSTLGLGADSFGTRSSHVTMFDHYQSQIRHELLPRHPRTVDTNLTQEVLESVIWGKGNHDDMDT